MNPCEGTLSMASVPQGALLLSGPQATTWSLFPSQYPLSKITSRISMSCLPLSAPWVPLLAVARALLHSLYVSIPPGPQRQLPSLFFPPPTPTPRLQPTSHSLLANRVFLTSKISCEERQLSPHQILLWVSRKKGLAASLDRAGWGRGHIGESPHSGLQCTLPIATFCL